MPPILTALASTDNGSEASAERSPYLVSVTIEGVAPLLFHRWQDAAVEAKSKARKNSAEKKTDDIESYVYRDLDGHICLPGVYLVGSLVDPKNGAAKYRQDPRSPRKSALDLYRAAVVPMTDLAPLLPVGRDSATDSWDYLDSRRVMVQRNAITRIRPAFLAGWRATVELQVIAPEYISPAELLDTLSLAGRLVGTGDNRPSHGRFLVTNFATVLPEPPPTVEITTAAPRRGRPPKQR